MKSNFEAQQEALFKSKQGIKFTEKTEGLAKTDPVLYAKMMFDVKSFLTLIMRRCRVCTYRVLDCVKNGGEVSNDWANRHLCVTCLVLYKNRQPKEKNNAESD